MCAVIFGLTSLVGFIVFARKGRRFAIRALLIPVIFMAWGSIFAFVNATIIGKSLILLGLVLECFPAPYDHR